MAFKAFQTGSQSDDLTLPWTEEYISQDNSRIGMVIDVISVRLTEKGMMVTTSVSKAFVYKSNAIYSHLLEFLEAWSGRKEKSPLLQVKLTASRPFIEVGVDDIRFGIWGSKTDNNWRQAYATTSDNQSVTTNPLPMPSRPSVSVPSDDSASACMPEEPTEYLPQTSQDLGLAAPARASNGVKGRNTPRRK